MRITIALAVILAAVAVPGEPAAPAFERRWVYFAQNLQVKERADDLIRIIGRADKAGYNGVVLADFKLNILGIVPPHYFDNVARVRDEAAARRIELIPCVFPIGYSSGLLYHDANLAEGVPVKDAPFVARDADLVPAGEPPAFRNGGFEESTGDRCAGYSFQDDIGKTTFVDREVRHGGAASLRMQDPAGGTVNGNCRIAQRVTVRPYSCYRFSAWVKTRGLQPTGGFRLLALGTKGGRALTFYESRLKPTQDWEQVEVVFNSLDQTEVTLYAGQWGGKAGSLWLDDLALDEMHLVNVLRRPGCPFIVASADTATVYAEGQDYAPVGDELLGQRPFAGNYDFRHAGAAIRLTPGSRIRPGQRLSVSWYHPVIIHGEQVACCLSEPKVDELLRDQVRRVEELLHPKTYFFGHDELRVAGWCESCRKAGRTPGELLAQQVRRCVAIVKAVNPMARIVIWSDMFDPNHNAVDNYYLVNGTLAGSWDGLPKDVVVANWNGGKAADSLRWFAGRGHDQVIAGYYDDGPGNYRRWAAAARGVTGVRGFMYTTWENRYEQLEAFGKLMAGGE